MPEEKKPSILLYLDTLKLCLDTFGPEDLRAVLLALWQYAEGLEVEQPAGEAAQLAFRMLAQQHDRDCESWRRGVERNRANGKKGGRPHKSTDCPKANQKPVGFSKTGGFSKTPYGNGHGNANGYGYADGYGNGKPDDAEQSSSSGDDDDDDFESYLARCRQITGSISRREEKELRRVLGEYPRFAVDQGLERAAFYGAHSWDYIHKCIKSSAEEVKTARDGLPAGGQPGVNRMQGGKIPTFKPEEDDEE